MNTNCAPLVADFWLFRFERDFYVISELIIVIGGLNSTSIYLNDLLNIINSYFEQMVGQIYPTFLQLNKVISLILKPLVGMELRVRWVPIQHV